MQTRLRAIPSGGLLFSGLILLLAVCTAYPDEYAAAQTGIRFDAVVSCGYSKGRELRGWSSARQAIQATLKEWYGAVSFSLLQNPSPEQVQQFFCDLPGADGVIHLIYIGARTTSKAAWSFTCPVNGDVPWSALLGRPGPKDPGRLVILDICNAGAVAALPVWRENPAPASVLLASDSNELTYELSFTVHQPVDLSKRFPQTAAWLRKNMPPDWDGRLSYLGLIWVQTFLQAAEPPKTVDDWRIFFQRCEAESIKFRRETGWLNASTVRQISLDPAK